jgi:hypothetical protein
METSVLGYKDETHLRIYSKPAPHVLKSLIKTLLIHKTPVTPPGPNGPHSRGRRTASTRTTCDGVQEVE